MTTRFLMVEMGRSSDLSETNSTPLGAGTLCLFLLSIIIEQLLDKTFFFFLAESTSEGYVVCVNFASVSLSFEYTDEKT